YALEGHPMEIENFSLEMVNYDKNGNITYLKRHGLDVSSNEMDYIDDLTYNYAPKSNTLISVIDIASEDGFKDGNTINEDYFYDDNGNMTQDKNKHIAHIEYNHLNLPTFIYIESSGDGGGDINYTYDATGVKLEKVVNSGMDINATYYAGSYIYEESSQMGLMGPISSGVKLKFFNQPEGYVEPNSSGNFDYIYQYKDHLGNIRLSYNKGSYQSLIESAFYEEYDGWIYNGGSANGNIELESGRLKVNVLNPYNGASIIIGDSFVTGAQVDISIEVDKAGTDKIYAVVQELDTNNNVIAIYNMNSNLHTGSYNFSHTV